MRTLQVLVFLSANILVRPLITAGEGVYIETLEDIGPDGTVVSIRQVGPVTVEIFTSGSPMRACTYGLPGTSFGGGRGLPLDPISGANDMPLAPDNVSGSRFISTVYIVNSNTANRFQNDQPITFELAPPVQAFGLTTLDLLENDEYTPEKASMALSAYDIEGNLIDVDERRGAQGPSGLDLDWHVESASPEIAKVVLSSVWIRSGGYGIDDIAVELNDADGDGLPDSWEESYGLDPFDPTGDNGPDGDPDRDGRNNLVEWMQGTHPLSVEAWMEIQCIDLVWTCVEGVRYQVYRTDNLDDPVWEPVGPPIEARGGTLRLNQIVSDGDLRFFKVEPLP